MRTPLLLTLVLSIPLAFGQLDSNSITVTASRSTTTGVQPDQAVFTVQVSSGLDASLDDVLAALQGTGITTVNFVTMSSFVLFPQMQGQPGPLLGWTFRYAVPLNSDGHFQPEFHPSGGAWGAWISTLGTARVRDDGKVRRAAVVISDALRFLDRILTGRSSCLWTARVRHAHDSGFALHQTVTGSSGIPVTPGYQCRYRL